jgi:hypothetical protein
MLTNFKGKVAILLLSLMLTSISNSQCPPELLYYRFKLNTGSTTKNFAEPGAGSLMASVIGHHLGPGGQFDSCLVGMGGTTNYVNTGWATNIGTGNWTISFWVKDLQDRNPTYLFGDQTANNFRCYYGGSAGSNNILLRGSFPDITIYNVMPGPTVIHIVYNGTSVNVYKNAIWQNSYARSGLNLSGTGPFEVGGMVNHNCLNTNGLLDEFRFYNRALSFFEIQDSWNVELECITGIEPKFSIPNKFVLSQNYPNPFNPSTIIKYGIPKSTLVKLTIYDETGKEVALLINEVKPAGNYEFSFDGGNFSSGVYLYKLETNDFRQTRKMILMK